MTHRSGITVGMINGKNNIDAGWDSWRVRHTDRKESDNVVADDCAVTGWRAPPDRLFVAPGVVNQDDMTLDRMAIDGVEFLEDRIRTRIGRIVAARCKASSQDSAGSSIFCKTCGNSPLSPWMHVTWGNGERRFCVAA